MQEASPYCFVIMPFRPELHYFYLYLKRHVEERYRGLTCERADARVLTVPLLEKISDSIRRSDVIIADCTGKNPNVFYELGLAHAYEKPVILITQDDLRDAPSDIRHFEFIRYALEDEVGFFSRLDSALHHVFAPRYEAHYQRALACLRKFQPDTARQVKQVPQETFVRLLLDAHATGDLPDLDDEAAATRFLLPRIVDTEGNVELQRRIAKWIAQRPAASAPEPPAAVERAAEE